MKFGQFMSYSKKNNFIKKFYKKCILETSSKPFCVRKELTTTSVSSQSTLILQEVFRDYQINLENTANLSSSLWGGDIQKILERGENLI